MADFQEIVKQFKRMCNNRECCDNCHFNTSRGILTCYRWLIEHPEEAEDIIMNWAKKNPIKTNRDKFIEVFGFDPIKSHVDVFDWYEEEYKEPENE